MLANGILVAVLRDPEVGPPRLCIKGVRNVAFDAKPREQLEARLRALQRRLDEINEILRQPESRDSVERAGEWDDDNMLTRLADSITEEISLIRDALKSIDEGHYGKCKACGKPIDRNRLLALPQATMCVRCAHVAA
jgi:RNA polymerase-binding transcription factor DksA